MKIEILSPAGSMESLYAAIRAGADAVYAGGTRFSARASAINFSKEELLQGIDYVHIHNRKFYLTVNTLLKEREINDLYDYLAPLYERGLDAVIVQDVGVLQFIKQHFPKLDIHASTQMTITGGKGALFLANQGVKRVVPARELSLSEITEISRESRIEVECFVHGALCYSYSGQCLLSSVIGGRSGNRGQCAQPCRLWYEKDDEKGYLLSLKDICTLSILPQLIDAGITSFKIEGRMKKPEYVALTTALYRKYSDLYLAKGLSGYKVSEEDQEMLLDLYNRGGFHSGYYHQHHGADMIVRKRPNHAGVPALQVQGQKKQELFGVALTHINKGDVLELAEDGSNYTFGKEMKKGDIATLRLPNQQRIEAGRILYRVRNTKLIENIQASYLQSKKAIPIQGHLLLEPFKPARLLVWTMELQSTSNKERESQIAYEAWALSPDNPELAKTRPLDREKIIKQLEKTGNTEFEFEHLEVEMIGNVFLPLQQINELRRRALEELKEVILATHRRKLTKLTEKKHLSEKLLVNVCVGVLSKEHDKSVECTEEAGKHNNNVEDIAEVEEHNKSVEAIVEDEPNLQYATREGEKQKVSVSVETIPQLEAVMTRTGVNRIYFHESLLGKIEQWLPTIRKKGMELFVAMPHIFRQATIEQYEKGMIVELLKATDGVLVRNFESVQFLKEQKFDKSIVLDHNLYTFNSMARKFWQEQSLFSYTAPVELRYEELKELAVGDMELLVYGRIPVMVSAQCIHQGIKCPKKNEISWLIDRKQMKFPVKNFCDFCYNVMYNSVPLCLFGHLPAIDKLKPAGLRLAFTTEDKEETTIVLQKFFKKDGEPLDFFTAGHFKRGVL